MAYRDGELDHASAPTADGDLQVELGPRSVKLSVPARSLLVAGRFATVIEHHAKNTAKDRRSSLKLEGRLVVARDVPHDDLGVWIEVDPGQAKGGMRRIFGVEPRSLLDAGGLDALAALDRVATRVKHELADLGGDIRRAFEIGRGLDKVLLADHGDRYQVYARRLFRDRARFVLAIYGDGRIVIPDGKKSQQVEVRSRYGVTVWGDYIRFADPHGTDLGKVSIPWIAPEDRLELARRIGQLVDAEGPAHDPTAWLPAPSEDEPAKARGRRAPWRGYGRRR